MSKRVSALVAAAALAAITIVSVPGDRARAQTAHPPASATASVPAADVPFYSDWANSAHARRDAEAFTYWNKEGKIPSVCARCHSTPGFLDFLGADGSAAGTVEQAAPVGTVITCAGCHDPKARALTSVTFPSGVKVDNLGADARCMSCHQGRESAASVNKATAKLEADAVEPKLGFVNIHYRAAGATLMGAVAKGGYEYAGKAYAGRSPHPAPYTGCNACHETHSGHVKAAECARCHNQAADAASLKRIRMSAADYDGNGDAKEGIGEEVEHLRTRLYAAITAYGKDVAKKPIVYDAHLYPYFFVDANGNGIADKEELQAANKYNAWTPRLLKAAYNYQFVTKDPGAYAHNPAYALQLLFDSLGDLGAKVSVDLAKAKRP